MELNRLFQGIIDQLDGAAILNREGHYIYANQGWERIMGIPFESVRGTPAVHTVAETRALESMEKRTAIYGTPTNRQGHEMFSNYLPIILDDQVVGCFIQIIFGNVEEAFRFSNSVNALIKKLDYYQNQVRTLEHKGNRYTLDSIVGVSDAVNQMKQQILVAAGSLSNVLIEGETGSGKELVAQAIHYLSSRREQPFIKINCAAIPLPLAESEFFGYEGGAFTGASRKGKEGVFELANTGSLLLDEIHQLDYMVQPKILRVLQEREVRRVGGDVSVPIDIRVIAACNQNLSDLSREDKFRQDLFYRLNVIRIKVPPLRDRLDDIPVLVNSIIQRLNTELGFRVEGIEDSALDYLLSYHWPGNIRQLQNAVEQAMNTQSNGMLRADCFDLDTLPRGNRKLGAGTLEQQKRKLEKAVILDAYEQFDGNKQKVARYLGISRPMLYNRLKEYQVIP